MSQRKQYPRRGFVFEQGSSPVRPSRSALRREEGFIVSVQERQYDGDRALCHQCHQSGSPLYDFYSEDEDGAFRVMGCSACAMAYGRAKPHDLVAAIERFELRREGKTCAKCGFIDSTVGPFFIDGVAHAWCEQCVTFENLLRADEEKQSNEGEA